MRFIIWFTLLSIALLTAALFDNDLHQSYPLVCFIIGALFMILAAAVERNRFLQIMTSIAGIAWLIAGFTWKS